MTERARDANGASTRKKSKAELMAENRKRRLEDKARRLRAGIERLIKELKLSSDGVYVSVVDTKITVNAQCNLLRKSQRLPGMPNSEEELDPA